MNSPNKKRETLEDIDRISNLPDSILTKILSLIPTKESVCTSVLSTRWKPIYTSVPVLDFRQNEDHPHPDTAYMNFVSQVLNTVTQKLGRISKLSICNSCFKPCTKNSHVTSWVETAVAYHVEVLHVQCYKLVPNGARMNFPGLFTSGTLVSLTLDLGLQLSVPDFVFMPKLKKIWMKNVYLKDESDDESVRRFFSGCPVLEELTMCFWRLGNSKVFNVSVPSLKRLSVLFSEKARSKLLINCPNLEDLDYEDSGLGGYSGDVFESLKKCTIETDILLHGERMRYGKLIDLVKQACKTRSLVLAGDAMEALRISPCLLPTFENLTHLELESNKAEGWRFLPDILRSSPRLESLCFSMGFFDIHIDEYTGVPFSPPCHVPTCLSHHLKFIRINKYLGEEDEYKLVEYFLTNGVVLEKMEICPWSTINSDEEDDSHVEGKVKKGGEAGEGFGKIGVEEEDKGEEKANGEVDYQGHVEEKFDKDLERHFQITKRLLSFQRFSEVCQIILEEPDQW